MKTTPYTVNAIVFYEVRANSKKEAVEKIKEKLKGEDVFRVEVMDRPKSRKQENAYHLWFEQVAEEANEKGLTVDALILKPSEFPITKGILKDYFREVGKIMFGKDSTIPLTEEEATRIIEVCERAFAERLDNTIPFPSKELNN